MATPSDNRVFLIAGAAAVLIVAVSLALWFGRGPAPTTAPPASQGGLTVDVADAPALESTRELRCFVAGRFVGMATLAQCAERNGLATDALDVGIDETGGLAAAPTASLAPPPVEPSVLIDQEPLPDLPPVTDAGQPVAAAGESCLRHVGGDWRAVSSSMSLSACVQALYSGTCVRPGDALYGRWGNTTLRLVPGRVERSENNADFRTLVEQDRRCNLGPIN
jgi:hypothetical protein